MPRPDGPLVAIDGPAGAGKSTVAREVARRLGLRYLDTGALYRAVGWRALQAGVDPADAAALEGLMPAIVLHFERGPGGATRIWVGETDVTDRIRTPEVSLAASAVAGHGFVRDALLGLQRAEGARGGAVLDGRDIGTVVFPDADVKVFLDASPEVRAQRRCDELAARGEPADYGRILAETRDRDAADRGRAVAPLKPAPDAVLLDTTELPAEAVIERVCSLVRGAAPAA